MALDLRDTYVRLRADGAAETLPGGPRFWAQTGAALDAAGGDWLVTEFACEADWENWEMHPEGDELVCLLAGAVTLLLERPGGLEEIALAGGGTVLVPRGVWHTARVHAPSRLLHITRGKGTRHRPA